MNFSALDQYLDSLLTELHLPMYDCTIHVNYQEVYRRQGGFIDTENRIPHKPDTKYFLYSVTKPLTCAAALTLFEKGKYLLNEPLSRYLPEFADVQVEDVLPNGQRYRRPPARPIRIGDLFTMTAGFTYNLRSDNIRAVLNENENAPTREIIRALAKDPLSFDPGTRFQYSLCHDVIAALVEVIAGERFSDYVKRVILDPLEMSNTGFHFPAEELEATMAPLYNQPDRTRAPEKQSRVNQYVCNPMYDSGGAGLISTPEDYIRFADMLANQGIGKNGARILSPATVSLMHTNFLTPAQMDSFAANFGSYYAGYGYGLGVRTLVDRARGGSIGPIGEFGWGGAAGSQVYCHTESRTAIFYAQHTLNPPEDAILPRLRNIAFACLHE